MPDKKLTSKKAKKVYKKAAAEGAAEAAKEIYGSKSMATMKYNAAPEMGHSPAEMESAKQEKYNLMHDNPVAKDASGKRDMSWMSKHVTKVGGSPIKKHCM
tara:strand:- start:126 stop:428 length:303 start_codon:yes stop_codon:yes gene_type:complete